jgi:phage protein U
MRLVVLEGVEQTLWPHEAGGTQGLGGLERLATAREEVDLADVLPAQRIALPGWAVEELEQVVNGRRVGRAERSRTDAAAEVEGHRGADRIYGFATAL